MSLGFASAKIGSKQSFLEYHIPECTARQGHQKAQGQLVSNLDQQTASYDLRKSNFFIGYRAPLKMNR